MVAYILLFFLIFVINIIPAFMPPTWIVLAFLYLHFHLDFMPTVLVGVTAATSGRIVLAIFAHQILGRIIPERMLKNYKSLGLAMQKHQHMTIPIVFAYAFSPISSNTLFIIVGLSNVNIELVAFSFFVGRLFTYSFWILATSQVAKRLEDIFSMSLTSTKALASFAVTLLIIVIIGKIDWEKHLLKNKPKKLKK